MGDVKECLCSTGELHRPNHQHPYQSLIFLGKPKKNTNWRPHFLVRLADPKIGLRNLRHLLFPLTQKVTPKAGLPNGPSFGPANFPFNPAIHSGGPLSGNLFCMRFLALVLGTRFAPFNPACMEAMLIETELKTQSTLESI